MAKHAIHGPPLFTEEGPGHYAAAQTHNEQFARASNAFGTTNWETVLSGGEETSFRAWVKAHSVPFDVEAAENDYDMRGFWKETGGAWPGGGAHFTDKFKTPRDTSFSNQSRYAESGCPFKWVGEILVDYRTGQVIFNEEGRYPMSGFVDDGGGPTLGVGVAQPVRSERFVPGIHSVQGINSHIEDIKLRGVQFIAIIGDAIVDATLIRKTVGASELTLTVLDPSRKLLRSKLLEEAHEVVLDGLHWKLVKVASEGRNEPLVLTYEPLIVYLLKQLKGPHKSFRDKMTRAEFAQARAYEAKPRPRFVAPELHVVQDIASAAAGQKAKKQAEESRGKGIGVADPDLKINDRPATKAQAEIIERMLRTAESEDAASKVMEALVLAVIDESIVGTLSDNLLQIEPGGVSGFDGDPTNPEQSARGFLRGYEPSAPGALGVYKAHPDYSAAQIATTVQRNRDGAGPYERFTAEGRAWVAAYGGGAEVGTRDFQRFAFEQSKPESNWHCMVRLATGVHWRCFESAAWIYFLNEPTLLRASHRMRISDSAPGIIDTSFDYDVGKEVTEVTVEALANTWAAPPGSVAAVSRHGPADGLYIVEQIESKPSSRKEVVNVTLRKPTEPLPEPAPKQSRSSTSLGGGSTEAATSDLAGVQITNTSPGAPYWGGTAAVFKQFIHPFMEKEGLQPGAEKEEGHAQGSDHALYSTTAYATDYPTTDGAGIADRLGRALGRPGSSVGTYARFDITVDGHRFSVQILWAVPDHYDHVHVGLQRL